MLKPPAVRTLLPSLIALLLAPAEAFAQKGPTPTPMFLPPSSVSGPVSQKAPVPDLTLLGEPKVENWSPKTYVVQGETLSFVGKDLVAREFHARTGQPPVLLPVVGSGTGSTGVVNIRVQVPATLVSPGSPLVVWYGINGPKKTLASSFKVLKKPRVVAFRVTDGPFIDFGQRGHAVTKIEVELADFDPTAESVLRPVLRVSGASSGWTPAGEVGGSPVKLKYDVSFPAELSGKRSALEVCPYGFAATVPAGEIQFPTVQTYTISNTWDLLSFTTPSGKKLTASASKGVLPCQLASVGTAGSFATGVVNDGGDISFQLRNGLLQENCHFETSPALSVRDEWIVKSVRWDFTEDSLCVAVNKLAIQTSSGSPVSFFFDKASLFPVKFDALCTPDAKDLAKNSHVFKARLSSAELIGPAGKSWRDAFK